MFILADGAFFLPFSYTVTWQVEQLKGHIETLRFFATTADSIEDLDRTMQRRMRGKWLHGVTSQHPDPHADAPSDDEGQKKSSFSPKSN